MQPFEDKEYSNYRRSASVFVHNNDLGQLDIIRTAAQLDHDQLNNFTSHHNDEACEA